MEPPERCDECGFDGSRVTVGDAIAALRSMRRRWAALFEDVPDEVLRTRAGPGVWSALEYAAHTRDVIGDNTVEMAAYLEGRRPEPSEFGPDEDEDAYNSEDPEVVLAGLGTNAEAMAARASEVLDAAAWTRSGGGDVDAGWMLRHAVHDASHHLKDVSKGLEQLN
jgi:hypothetical protein